VDPSDLPGEDGRSVEVRRIGNLPGW